MLDDAKVSQKRKTEILNTLNNLVTDVASNLPFITELMREDMEKVVANAKTEVEAFETAQPYPWK